jgi:hypothetical protein
MAATASASRGFDAMAATLRLIAPALAVFSLLAAAGAAAAHEHVTVANGKYEFIVGWKNEPVYAGVKNGLDLGVNRVLGETGQVDSEGNPVLKTEPIPGLVGNLTATYEIAGKTFTPPDWRAQFGRNGWYTAEITPTREGEYTIHVVGNIEGNPIDVRVKPHEVEALEETMFPEKDLSPEEASAKIADLEQQVGGLKTELAALKTKAQSGPTPAVKDATATPGFGVALAALGAVGVALALRKRK